MEFLPKTKWRATGLTSYDQFQQAQQLLLVSDLITAVDEIVEP